MANEGQDLTVSFLLESKSGSGLAIKPFAARGGSAFFVIGNHCKMRARVASAGS
jgi:hypothetical protein